MIPDNREDAILSLDCPLGPAVIVRSAGLAGTAYLIADMGETAGLENGQPVKYLKKDGVLAIATPAAAAKVQVEADRLTILRQMTDPRPMQNTLHWTRIVLHWSQPVPTTGNEHISAIDGTVVIGQILSRESLAIRTDEALIGVRIYEITTADFVWTSYGKPPGAEPPNFQPDTK